MIKVNGLAINVNKFPDGTVCMLDFPDVDKTFKVLSVTDLKFKISWFYDNDSELVVLQYIVSHLRENYPAVKSFELFMPYIPNARMDRVDPSCKSEQVFTLKYFANIINSMHFDKVYVLDPHSSVSVALINNVVEYPVFDIIDNVITNIESFSNKSELDIVIYTPDAGAYKRYSSLLKNLGFPFIYGEKMRDFATGKIEGLRIITNGLDLKGKTVLMIDDIIAYGGTFYYSAQELRKMGVSKIYAYATHTENSILELDTKSNVEGELKSKFLKMIYLNEVERLYTTNTIFRGNTNDSHITVISI